MFKSTFGACLALFAAKALAYPSAEERASVQEWDDMATKYGFDYELYRVVTEDDWRLTLFRITGRAGEEPATSTKPPVLIVSDIGQDAAVWVSQQAEERDPYMLQLVDRGYDVWMSNDRGTRYSQENPRFPEAENRSSKKYRDQNKAKYDFSDVEKGIYDQPANLDKILEVTGAEKVTFVGYGNGALQLIAGLTQLEETYYADRLNKAVFLAPCFFGSAAGIQFYRAVFPILRDSGVNTVMGPGAQSTAEAVCEKYPNQPICFFMTSMAAPTYQLGSLKTIEYIMQVSNVGIYQEYMPDYATATSLISPEVTPGIDSIDKVPIQMLLAASDTSCPGSLMASLRHQIKTIASYTFLPDVNNDHYTFLSVNTESYVDELVRQIELEPVFETKADNGTQKECEIPDGQVFDQYLEGTDGAHGSFAAFSVATVTLLVSAVSLF